MVVVSRNRGVVVVAVGRLADGVGYGGDGGWLSVAVTQGPMI